MRKGQITMFVIAGIVIVVIVGLIVFLKGGVLEEELSSGMTEDISLPPDVKEYSDHVEACIDETALTGLVVLGLQGGYAEAPEGSLETDEVDIAYWYESGSDVAPTKAEMEESLAKYLETYVETCVKAGDFPAFTEISTTEPDAMVTIGDDTVGIEMDYATTLGSDEASFELNRPFMLEYDVRLGKMIDVADSVVDQEVVNPTQVDVDYLLSTGIDVDILNLDDDNTVYVLTDSMSTIKGEPYALMFANNFEEGA